MSEQRIICGDAMTVLPSLDGGFGLCLTDPPYGISFSSAWRKKSGRLGGVRNDASPFVWWLGPVFDLMANDSAVVLFTKWSVWQPWSDALTWAGFSVSSQIVWHKGGGGTGALHRDPALEHELALFATKGKYRLPGGRPMSVYRVPKVQPPRMVHPTEKPVELMELLVRDFCQPGLAVLDPFAGVSPVGVACKTLGVDYTGIEIEQKYCDIAMGRLAEVAA